MLFIRGNPRYGTKEMHQKIEKIFSDMAKELKIDFKALDSDKPFSIAMETADVYIGFSRGSRYFKNIKGVKIGIGANKGNYQFINAQDNTGNGDISLESLESHFIVTVENQKKIKKIIRKVKECKK